MLSLKEILNKILSLLDAFEKKAQLVIFILLLTSVVVPWFMFDYFNGQLEECKRMGSDNNKAYEIKIDLLRSELSKTKEDYVNEVRNCKTELIALIREVKTIQKNINK